MEDLKAESGGTVDRKKFGARLPEVETDKTFHPLYWDTLNGKDVWESICNLILRNLRTNFDVATKLAGGIKFKDYKPPK